MLVWLGSYDMFEQPKQLALKVAATGVAVLLALEASPAVPAALLWPVATALAAGLVSAGLSPLRLTGFFGEYTSYQGWLHWITLATLVWGAAVALRRASASRRALAAVTGGLSLVALYALLQLAGADPVPWSVAGPLTRTFSTTGNPLYLGCLLAAGFPVALGLAATAPSPASRWITLALSAVILAGLVTSGSRSALGAALAGAAVFFLQAGPAVPRHMMRHAAIAGGIALLGCGLLLPPDRNPFPLLARRFMDVARGEDGRPQIWLGALGLLRERPLLGHGPDSFATLIPGVQTPALWRYLWHGSPEKAHNDILQMLATVGILGTGALAWIAAALARFAGRRLPLASAAAGGLAAYAVSSLFAFGTCAPQAVAVALAGLLAGSMSFRALPRSIPAALAVLLGLSLIAHLQFATAEVALKASLHAGGRGLDRALTLHTPWAQRLLRAGDTLEHAALGDQLGAAGAPGTAALASAIDRMYLEAGVLNPLHPFAHSDHARMLAREGRTAEALAEYGEARRLAPLDAYLSLETAQTMLAADRDEEARAVLGEVIVQYPGFAEPYGLLGYSWIRRRDWARAIPWLERSLPLDWHGNAGAGYAAANNLAAAYHRTGRDGDAARAASDAVRFAPAP